MIGLFFSRQFARFVLVGGTAALVNWCARWALGYWIPFGWSVAIAYLVGMTTAFVLNSVYVFPRSDKPRAAQMRDFVIINLAFLPLVWMLAVQLDLALIALGMRSHTKELAHAMAIAAPMLATFLLYKFLAFRESAHAR